MFWSCRQWVPCLSYVIRSTDFLFLQSFEFWALNSEELFFNDVQHEKHEEKKDPENARRHKIEEEVAAAAAVGEGGYGVHEDHEKKESKEEAKETDGKKHHHLF